MVHVQKSVQGYEHRDAIARAPDGLQAKVSEHVHGLEKLAVKQNANKSISDNMAHAQALRGDLKGLVRSSKVDAVMKGLSLNALQGDLHSKVDARMKSGDSEAVKYLKDSVHISAKEARESGMDRADRMVVRTALVLAFAHGASKDELAGLRKEMTSGDAARRQHVLNALNVGKADPGVVLASLKGQDGAEATKRVLDWCNTHQLGRIGEDASEVGEAITEKVDAYFKDKPENTSLGRVGATAISVYSSQAYDAINKELRQRPLSKEVDEIVTQAKEFMAKLPDFQGIVCRGGGSGWQDVALEKYVPGKVVTEESFTSTSPNLGFPGSVQFIIESKHGKEVTDLSISAKADGREVLFPPGAKFEVLAVERGDEDYLYLKNAYTGEVEAKPDSKGEKIMYIIMREVD